MIGHARDPVIIDASRVMTMRGAYELAAAVMDDIPGARVIAIGRFVPQSQVTPESPWGVSMQLADGRKAVVWSPADVDALMGGGAKCPPKSTDVAAKKKKVARAAAEVEPAAGWLFGGPV